VLLRFLVVSKSSPLDVHVVKPYTLTRSHAEYSPSFERFSRPQQTPTLNRFSLFCHKNRILPSIFIYGTQKCGTTTFADYLSKQSGLTFGVSKEHYFFNDEGRKRTDRGKFIDFNTDPRKTTDGYSAEYPNCDWSKIGVDGTTSYTMIEGLNMKFLERLQTIMGSERLKHLRFITMVCDPVHRYESWFYHMQRHWHPEWQDNAVLRQPGVNFGKMGEVLHNFLEAGLIRPEQIMLINNKHLFSHHVEVLREVMSFLGLPERFRSVKYRHANKKKGKLEMPMSDQARNQLKQIYEKDLDLLRKRIIDSNIRTIPNDLAEFFKPLNVAFKDKDDVR